MDYLDKLDQEHERLLKARPHADKAKRNRIDKRLSFIEQQILTEIETDDMRSIDAAKHDDKVVTDAFTDIIIRVQARRDTLETLKEDHDIMEIAKWG